VRYSTNTRFTKNRPALPLYTQDEAARKLALLRVVAAGESMALSDNVTLRFRPVGHILGAASLEVE